MKFTTQASGLFAATLIAASFSALVVSPAHAAPRGQLAAIGQRDAAPAITPAAASHLTRSDVRQEFLAARADGTLLPAGQGAELYAFRTDTSSTLTRGEVKAEVVAAQKAGELSAHGEESVFEANRGQRRAVSVAEGTPRNVFTAWLAKHRGANAASGI